jgi:hypothetical protein
MTWALFLYLFPLPEGEGQGEGAELLYWHCYPLIQPSATFSFRTSWVLMEKEPTEHYC